MTIKAICPSCERETSLSASNAYRPFCSKRCRLIDLGEWISENYSITDNKMMDDLQANDIKKH